MSWSPRRLGELCNSSSEAGEGLVLPGRAVAGLETSTYRHHCWDGAGGPGWRPAPSGITARPGLVAPGWRPAPSSIAAGAGLVVLGWRPALSSIAAGTGLVVLGWAEMGPWAVGWVWGGPGGMRRDMSVLRIVIDTRSPCLSPHDYKNRIKPMIFCLYHIISSAHPYFQGMGSTKDYGGFCSDAT